MSNSVAATPHSNHVRGELAAASAITPGHLVEIASGKYQPASTALAKSAKMFALENISIAGSIDTPYVADDTTFVGSFPAGERVRALLAIGETIVDGTLLASAGDGTLIATGATADNAVAVSRSEFTTTTVVTRITAELI